MTVFVYVNTKQAGRQCRGVQEKGPAMRPGCILRGNPAGSGGFVALRSGTAEMIATTARRQ